MEKDIRRPLIICEPGLTRQSEKDSCDINFIMKQYTQKGILPSILKENPQFADMSTPFDYQEALNTVLVAQTMFDALPAIQRDRFNNDAAKMLEFVSNPDNTAEAIKLGLAVEKAPIIEEKPPIKAE